VRRVIVEINGQKVLQTGAGLWKVLLLNIDFGEGLVGSRVPWLDVQCGFELLNCALGLAKPEVTGPELEVRLGIEGRLNSAPVKDSVSGKNARESTWGSAFWFISPPH
jgi:hypothetical protein